MTISRGQMERQLRMGGGIMDVVPREPAIFGGIKKAVKKVTKGVKDIVKSDAGKAALLAAGAYYLGGGTFGGLRPNAPGFQFSNIIPGAKSALFGDALTLPKGAQLVPGRTLGTRGILGKAGEFALGEGIIGQAFKGGGGNLGKLATLGALSTFLTSQFGMTPEEAEEEIARNPSKYLEQYYRNLNPPGDKDPEVYEKEVRDFVTANTSEYAVGGRVGFAAGSDELPEFNSESNIIPLSNDGEFKYTTPSEILPEFKYMSDGPVLPPDPTQPVNPFGPKPPADAPVLPDRMASNMENDKILESLFEKYLDMGLSPKEAAERAKEEFDRMSNMRIEETRDLAAIGGKMDNASDNAMQAAGIEGLPIRQNPKGVKELDLRETGGFIPPVGIKEKEDDIPAMLSNNEFVFTADAVRGMGGGNVNKGAQMLYDQMKMLEEGGRVV